MRTEFVLDDDELKFILAVCKDVDPDNLDHRERVGQAWDLLGSYLGFDGRTVEYVPGKDEHWFTAEVVGGAGAA